MTPDRVAANAYRSLTRLYPRSFRLEYRDDLVRLFEDQCADEPMARVCARSIVDLAISVPTTHLEARMDRSPNPFVPLLFCAIAVAGLMLTLMAGTEPVPALIGLAVAIGGGALAFTSWRRMAAVPTPEPRSSAVVRAWWKVLGLGAALFAAALAVAAVNPELDGAWYAWIILLLSALVLTVTGVVLGLVALVTHRSHPTPV